MRSAGQDQTNDDSKCEATSAHQPLSSACFSLRETEASPSAAGFDFNALTQTWYSESGHVDFGSENKVSKRRGGDASAAEEYEDAVVVVWLWFKRRGSE